MWVGGVAKRVGGRRERMVRVIRERVRRCIFHDFHDHDFHDEWD